MIEHLISLEEISPLEIYGVNNVRFRHLKEEFPELQFVARGSDLKMRGPESEVNRAVKTLEALIGTIESKGSITEEQFIEVLLPDRPVRWEDNQELRSGEVIVHGARGNVIKARTEGQRKIILSSQQNDVVFAIGPAGTGKTYTAVAIAVKALKEKKVRKIYLVRPAVEAGENLGFLPGDLKEKLDPYLRPLKDALEDMLHTEKLRTLMEKNIIEIAPLAYMRGRTLSDAFVILDESQNATEMQFKMFLTRLGKGSKVIITGDDSQIDLPRSQRSGLLQCQQILKGIDGIDFVFLKASDVVRHRLVKKIIAAYDRTEADKFRHRREYDSKPRSGRRESKGQEKPEGPETPPETESGT